MNFSLSDKITIINTLNALIRTAYNAGLLDQSMSPTPGKAPTLLTPNALPSHPFFASDAAIGITSCRDALLSLLFSERSHTSSTPISTPSRPEGDSAPARSLAETAPAEPFDGCSGD